MKTFVAVILASALAAASVAANAQAATRSADATYEKAGEERAVNLCSTCHGPRGISTSPEFPILAAQRAGYLEAQIEAFRSKTREEKAAHDFMYGIAGNLNDPRVIAGIARYYASQPPAPARSGDPAIIAKGKEFFDKGSPDRGIPPCASCHGANAEGIADFPRLAGQHAKYVLRQLEYIQGLVRKAPVMHGIVKDLTPDEMEAVAVFVQSK
jgi:cytochrome c553